MALKNMTIAQRSLELVEHNNYRDPETNAFPIDVEPMMI